MRVFGPDRNLAKIRQSARNAISSQHYDQRHAQQIAKTPSASICLDYWICIRPPRGCPAGGIRGGVPKFRPAARWTPAQSPSILVRRDQYTRRLPWPLARRYHGVECWDKWRGRLRQESPCRTWPSSQPARRGPSTIRSAWASSAAGGATGNWPSAKAAKGHRPLTRGWPEIGGHNTNFLPKSRLNKDDIGIVSRFAPRFPYSMTCHD